MNMISNYFQRQSKERAERKLREIREDAENRYQITEFGGELWLTHNGGLVCPCSMLKNDAVESVRAMRQLYLERHEAK